MAAFTIIWFTPPNGVNCRHTWIFGIFLAWILSALVTSVTCESFVHRNNTRAKRHWHWILIKDTIIALVSLTVIFLSSAGLFNTCYCWSGIWRFGSEKANVLMNTKPIFQKNGRGVYPTTVALCLAAQVLFFTLIAIRSGRGLRVIRWSETEKMEVLNEMQQQRRTPTENRACKRCIHTNWLHSRLAALFRMGQ